MTFNPSFGAVCNHANSPLRHKALFISLICVGLSQAVNVRDARGQDRDSVGPDGQRTELYIHGANFSDPLRDVPQSSTVVQERRLEEKGETSIQYETESVMNLTWSGGSSRPRFFLIRGVGELEQYEGAPNPSVATIVDDIDFSGLGVVVPMFDIEQVEVLRGPQGIRFGSSALAGALNVRSKDATQYTTGALTVMAGNDEMGAGGFAVGGSVPGSDGKLLLRVSAFNQQSDGFRDNLYLNRDNTNSRNESVVRLKARYQESAALVFDLAAWVSEFNNGYDAFAIDNSLNTRSDHPGQDDTRSQASSFKVAYKANPSLKIESISTIMRAKLATSFDGDWGNNTFWAPYAPYDYFSDSNRTRRSLSQELRVTREDSGYQHGEDYRWMTGLFGQRLTENTATDQFSDGSIYDSVASDYRANTGAAYGDIEVPLGWRTSLSSGVRFEQRNARYEDTRLAAFSPTYSMLGGTTSLQHDINRIRLWHSVKKCALSECFFSRSRYATPSTPRSIWQIDRLYSRYVWLFKKASNVPTRW